MYRNQVAGHSPLFWHSGTICKPLIEAEYAFYAQLEEQMPAFVPYVPKFYGLLDLAALTEEMASSLMTETSDGNAGSDSRTGGGGGESDANSSVQDAAHSSIDGVSEAGGDSGINSTSSPSQPSAALSDSMTAKSSAGRLSNKWAMKCQQRKPGSSKPRFQYIVLEDLTFAYAKPCILDLKVGTRQHSDTEPPSKIASKTARCLHTTSHSLGLRLCGMQVYHPVQGMYNIVDKYWGRGLDVDGFKRALHDYLWDGERIVEEVVRAFVARMEKMRKAVMQWTVGRRFYSSSLLLVYEGDRNSRAGGTELPATSAGTSTANAASGLGEIDKPLVLRQGSESSVGSTGSGFFSPLPSPLSGGTSASLGSGSNIAHQQLATSASMVSLSTHYSAGIASPHAHSDKKLSALSLSSSVPSARSTLPASFSSSSTSSSPSPSTAAAAASPPVSSSGSTRLPSSPPLKLYSHKRKTTHAQAMALARQRGSIDVRIIDFAHTSVVGEAAVSGGVVEGGAPDSVDSGLLYGFDCLLQLLRAILDEARETREMQTAAD